MKECSEEDIKRAEEIAKSIEGNLDSKRNALLENDDEERDLHVKTEFKNENHPPHYDRQQHQSHYPQQQQRNQRPAREAGTVGGGPRKSSGSSGVGVGGNKRWQDRNGSAPFNPSPGDRISAEQQTSNWRTPNPTQPPHNQQRGSGGNFHYAKHQSSGYHHQQSRPFQQYHHQQSTSYFGGTKTNRYAGGVGSRASSHESNAPAVPTKYTSYN